MEPIVFLKYVRRQNVKISSEFENLKELEFMIHNLKSVQPDGSRHGSGYHSDISDKLILLERKRAAVAGCISNHLEAWEKAEKIINCVEKERGKLILYYRFILGYTWEIISKKLGISENQLLRIQKEAFQEIARF